MDGIRRDLVEACCLFFGESVGACAIPTLTEDDFLSDEPIYLMIEMPGFYTSPHTSKSSEIIDARKGDDRVPQRVSHVLVPGAENDPDFSSYDGSVLDNFFKDFPTTQHLSFNYLDKMQQFANNQVTGRVKPGSMEISINPGTGDSMNYKTMQMEFTLILDDEVFGDFPEDQRKKLEPELSGAEVRGKEINILIECYINDTRNHVNHGFLMENFCIDIKQPDDQVQELIEMIDPTCHDDETDDEDEEDAKEPQAKRSKTEKPYRNPIYRQNPIYSASVYEYQVRYLLAFNECHLHSPFDFFDLQKVKDLDNRPHLTFSRTSFALDHSKMKNAAAYED